MIAINCNIEKLELALKAVNSIFDSNIKLNNVKVLTAERVRFTLRVKDSKLAGAAYSTRGRRTGSACFHAHGAVIDALIWQNCTVYTTRNRKRAKITWYEDNWTDVLVGTNWHGDLKGIYHSELCLCTAYDPGVNNRSLVQESYDLKYALIRLGGIEEYLKILEG